MINVLVVDDHSLILEGIKKVLEQAGGMKVVGTARSGEEALALVGKCQPDVVIMDIIMPGIGGFEAVRKLIAKDPDLKIVMLSVHENPVYPTRFLKLGARAYVTKQSVAEELAHAVRAVYAGQRYMSVDISKQIALQHADGRADDPFAILAKRELQVALMVIQGLHVSQIAKTLFLSPKTVNSYRYRTFDKLGVKNDVSLALLAYRHGLIGDNGSLRDEATDQ